jgi:hypothetical protein
MAYTWTFNLTQTSDIGAQLSKASWPQVAGQEININLQFPSSTVNQLVPVVFTIASLQGLMMVASQPMTILTNDFTTPGNTISLAANVPIFWGKDQGIPVPGFTVDVTQMYVTSALAGRLQFKVLKN